MVTDRAARRAGRPARPPPCAGGLGRRPGRHPPDRRHRARRTASTCGFDWVDGYLHAPVGSQQAEEAETLPRRSGAGARARLRRRVRRRRADRRRPGAARRRAGALPSRAAIWPASPSAVVAAGGHIYERSAVEAFIGEPLGATANGFAVTGDDVVIATHNPLAGLSSLPVATLFQTKLALYTSYVVAARVPKGRVPDALWWDTADPYRYLRVEPGETDDLVIFGGEDHKTGQVAGTPACYARARGGAARAAARGAGRRTGGRARSSRRPMACRTWAGWASTTTPRPGSPATA